jgi:6-phosphogluconolactonase (cycloisomerase 2 family)
MKIAGIPFVLLAALACQSPDQPTAPLPLEPFPEVQGSAAVGQVFTMSNQVAGNAVLVYHRAVDGTLSAAGTYPTGGTGTGAGLGNQGGVVLSSNGRVLLAVNAGSNDLAAFLIRPNGTLERTGLIASGGTVPVSVTEHNGLVYVVNRGGNGNISGFTLSQRGKLAALAGSTRPLTGNATDPAQIQFASRGRVLVVTEKATNEIATYTVGAGGLATGPAATPSSGPTPFGFGVFGGLVVVSEAFGGAPDASALSSYEVRADGSLRLLSASVPTTETAACWVVITHDRRYAYTTNTGSNSISGYALHQGTLTLPDPSGATASTGGAPIDLALSRNGAYIYALTAAGHGIGGFSINADGSLTALGSNIAGLPAGTNGLAAY